MLVFHDLLRYTSPYREKRFVKTYADVGSVIREGISSYVKEVKERSFPSENHIFNADEHVLESLYGAAGKGAK
ncbi:3-methyl-2-oxobutanoate hydroxymethyltransferase [compost metagenome]